VSVESRLLSKVNVDEETGCWYWTACKISVGYGRLNVGGTIKLAHRVAYELYCAPIPEGMHVCHTCDNRGCVNPEHLFVGTNMDNVLDKMKKGRQTRGSTHGPAKLSESDVVAIREAEGVLHRDLAARFGVDKSQISCIRSGKYWAHVGRAA
jgi:hypothetical protein